jgi:acetyl-CoA carboxylase biotin carboxyl carrier protein
VDLEQLRELIQIFEAADISEVEIEEEGQRILLKKGAPPAPVYSAPPGPGPYAQAPQAQVYVPQPGAAAPAQAEPPAPDPEGEPAEEQLPTIDAPMVGVFYAAPAPGESEFVQPGDTVEAGQTVCIVEAMKLMNEVAAKSPCVIEKILVENAEPVEFGQPLFAVRPLEEE